MKDAPLKGVTGGRWSKDEQEQLEKAGVSFIREDGTIPGRNFVGLRLQKDIDASMLSRRNAKWGIIVPEHGEFLHADAPHHGVIPVGPTVALALDQPPGAISTESLIAYNMEVVRTSFRYVFARDLDMVLGRTWPG
jgi:hypothetical protein